MQIEMYGSGFEGKDFPRMHTMLALLIHNSSSVLYEKPFHT